MAFGLLTKAHKIDVFVQQRQVVCVTRCRIVHTNRNRRTGVVVERVTCFDVRLIDLAKLNHGKIGRHFFDVRQTHFGHFVG